MIPSSRPPQRASPHPLELPGRKAVHVWAASLDVAFSTRAALRNTLSPDELERAARFQLDQHRNRYLVGRGWLRQLLGDYLSVPAEALEFSYGPKGKPALTGSAGASELQFSLAHSEGLALLAIARATPVGADVERVRTLSDTDDLVARFFSKRESAAFQALSREQKPAAFFNLWTRKEAWLKATGDGIADLLSRVEVSFLPEEAARLLRLPESFGPATAWSLCDLSPGPGFAAALAVADRDAQPEFWWWDHERRTRPAFDGTGSTAVPAQLRP